MSILLSSFQSSQGSYSPALGLPLLIGATVNNTVVKHAIDKTAITNLLSINDFIFPFSPYKYLKDYSVRQPYLTCGTFIQKKTRVRETAWKNGECLDLYGLVLEMGARARSVK
jgi:hypothetical protein